VETAVALISQLAPAFPARLVDVVAEAAYHGPALRTLPGNVTWTCRIPRNAELYAAPDDDRRPFFAKPPWSARTQANPRCPRSLGSSRCITTKLQ
jgi:hypothetical protein